MRVVAGCDGGGTKCTVRVMQIADDGSVVLEGQATSGSANVKSDPTTALYSIQSATREALAAADLATDCALDSFVAALAGAGDDAVQREWEGKLSRSLPVRAVSVIPDVCALYASVDVPETTTVIATVVGTGSIAWARYPDRTMRRAGGLGPEVGDEGGGYWIGKEAMRRCGEDTKGALRDWIAKNIGQDSPELDKRRTAAIAAKVFALSGTDPIAKRIVESASEHIAALLIDVGTDAMSSVDSPLPWVCGGGVAVHQTEWLQEIRERCSSSGVFLTEPNLVPEPVVGAVRLAVKD